MACRREGRRECLRRRPQFPPPVVAGRRRKAGAHITLLRRISAAGLILGGMPEVGYLASISASSVEALRLHRVRPRWQGLALGLAGCLLPATVLCGYAPQRVILWAIVPSTGPHGRRVSVAGWQLQARCPEVRRVDDLLLGGILLIAAALIWLQIALQSGPIVARSLHFWPGVATVLVAACSGVYLMLRPPGALHVLTSAMPAEMASSLKKKHQPAQGASRSAVRFEEFFTTGC